jgi:hypothetical protein
MDLDLEKEIQNDIERYKRMKDQYRSSQIKSGEPSKDAVGRRKYTSDTERHFDNVIRELQALLRDR